MKPAGENNKTSAMVIVVDDNDQVRGPLAEVLRHFFVEVETFASAEAALEFILGVGPVKPGARLVVADVNLPGMDGIEFAQQVKIAFPYMPVVLMSGNGHRAQAEELHVPFYQKPFDPVKFAKEAADLL